MKTITVHVDNSEAFFDAHYMGVQHKLTNSGIPVSGLATTHGTFKIKSESAIHGYYKQMEVPLEQLEAFPHIRMELNSAPHLTDMSNWPLFPTVPYIKNPYRTFPTPPPNIVEESEKVTKKLTQHITKKSKRLTRGNTRKL